MSTEPKDPAMEPLTEQGEENLPSDDFSEDGPPEVLDTNVQIEMVHIAEPKVVNFATDNEGVKKLDTNGPATSSVYEAGVSDTKMMPNDGDQEDDIDELSDFDLEDEDVLENAWQDANIVARIVLTVQTAVSQGYQFLVRLTGQRLGLILLLVSFIAYFILAIHHEFGDEGSHRLVAITALGVAIWVFPYVSHFFKTKTKAVYGSEELSDDHKQLWAKTKNVIKWTAYVIMTGVMLYIVIDEGIKEPRNLQSLSGIFAFLLISLFLSKRPSKIHWHTIFWSVTLQFLFAVFVLKWKFGHDALIWLQDRFNEFFKNAHPASEFVFGVTYNDHFMIFGALPLLLFTNAVFTALYYLGVMQFIIRTISRGLKFFLHATAVETMSVSWSIFLEGMSALLMLQPFLAKMSKSELFTVFNGCMASLGGAYLAVLAVFGVSLEYLIPAVFISAPATFAISKLVVPESREITEDNAQLAEEVCNEEKKKYMNVFDAAQAGAVTMMKTMAYVLVLSFTFLCFIHWANHTMGWLGDRVGIDGLSIELISSYVLYPVALAMGVKPVDCRRVAMLLGYRVGVHNIVAFMKMRVLNFNRLQYDEYMAATNFTGTITRHRDDITLDMWNVTLTDGFLLPKSEAVATYALSGFSSALSMTQMLAILFNLVPHRKRWLTKNALLAMIAGTLANCITGCFAGMFHSED